MEKKIEAIIQELKQYPREPKSLTWIESVLEKHLQEPTEERDELYSIDDFIYRIRKNNYDIIEEKKFTKSQIASTI